MTKRMLIDATHAEETRVVVLDGNRLEDFDVETSTKKQLKGNIYLAKVVRVEPSLQAAFVEYGGGRHGFLAFSEIHPDYYQIPIADRERLLALQAEEARAEEEDDEDEDEDEAPAAAPRPEPAPDAEAPDAEAPDAEAPDAEAPDAEAPEREAEAAYGDGPMAAEAAPADEPAGEEVTAGQTEPAPAPEPEPEAPDTTDPHHPPAQSAAIPHDVRYAGETYAGVPGDDETGAGDDVPVASAPAAPASAAPASAASAEGPDLAPDLAPDPAPDFDQRAPDDDGVEEVEPDRIPELPPETIGGESDTSDEVRSRRAARFLRNYRIQEVIKRRQIMLVQVVKEERGTKGAALTSYISLAGRYCVLMPNSPRGGGISRKITSSADRKRLKEITSELDIPQGMGLIVRTAGANRPKPEIKRDCEYLMRLWDDIREQTLRSVAPALIYEEASLIKRAIRDVYSRDIDEIMVDGEDGWRAAHDFMRMLMPSHAKKVQLWRANGREGGGQPLFAKHQVEAQLDAMLSPTVQLKSGGYLVINQTEALVAIDVNSGRSTRERGIEETALRTNLEAADEVARELRLRDLAGLIVIDFIDMESKKNNAAVERRIKDALKNDRARIQVGHISHFGLLEMSRQRLRPSLAETSFVACPHCGGVGHVRSTESSAIHVLRAIEDEGAKGRASLILVHVAAAVIMYILNHKRERLADIEARNAMRVQFSADEQLVPPQLRIERLRAQVPESERVPERLAPVVPVAPALPEPAETEDLVDEPDEPDVVAAPAAADAGADARADESERRRRRRRRRRRGGRDGVAANGAESEEGEDEADDGDAELEPELLVAGDGTEQPPIPPGAFPVVPEPVVPVAASPAAEADTEAGEDGDDSEARRRRGRRGGRRRRRDGSEAEAAPGVAEPVAPVWSGPTPADPFGGQTYDIFDLIEQQEQAPPPPRPRTRTAFTETAEVVAEAPASEAASEPASGAPVEAPVEAIEAVETIETVAPAETSAAPPPPPEAVPEAAPEPATPEPVVGPAIKPLVLGQDAIPAEPKRGWWRR